MAFNTPGLDELDRMQSRPMGQLMRPPSAAQSMYKRQTAAYGRALRTLKKEGRTDGRSAIAAIELGQDAMDRGYQVGGIRRADEFKAGAAGYEQRMDLGARNLENTINRGAGGINRDQNNAPGTIQRNPVNPNATVGAGRGTPLSRPTDPVQGAADGLTRRDEIQKRNYAALDILGNNSAFPEDPGVQDATKLGVTNDQIGSLMSRGGKDPLLQRRILDNTLQAAKTPEEVDALRKRGLKMGIKEEDFNRRAQRRSLT